jgi:geranylgeranyl diphosphate synthase type II
MKINSSLLLSIDDLLELYVDKFKDLRFKAENIIANEPVYYFISSDGKLIRPRLLLAACNMFGGDLDVALNPAFGIQMFHNFTLVHDDIMDNSDVRRGRPSVHKKYSVNNAIISGDLMMIYAYDYLSKIDECQLREVFNNFNDTAGKIIEGQQMDIDFEARMDVDEVEYIKMIGYKTSVLLAESLRIGGVIANASNTNKELIYNFGLNLGLSFQIKDDWLDAFGAGEKFGKKIGGDILQNKKTMLFVKAWELADEKTKEKIKALMTHEDEDEKIENMLNIYNELGVNDLIENQMTEYFQKGLSYLEKIELPEERKLSLLDFAHKIYNRDF